MSAGIKWEVVSLTNTEHFQFCLSRLVRVTEDGGDLALPHVVAMLASRHAWPPGSRLELMVSPAAMAYDSSAQGHEQQHDRPANRSGKSQTEYGT